MIVTADQFELPPAALWRRAAARAIDAFTVFFILWLLAVLQLLSIVQGLFEHVQPEPWGRALVTLLLYLLAWATYETVFIRWNAGQTPGKQLVGIGVIRTDATEEPVSLRRALARWALVCGVLAVPPLPVGIVASALTGVSAPFDRRRRAIHDHVAGTRVVAVSRDKEDDADDESAEEYVERAADELANTTGSEIAMQLLFGRTPRRIGRTRAASGPSVEATGRGPRRGSIDERTRGGWT